MAQRVNASNISELEKVTSEMVAAHVFGYILTVFGWFIFGVGIIGLLFDAFCPDGREGATSCFILARLCSQLI
jgi:hypothetical protein